MIESLEKNRGISNNTLLRFGITEAMEWMPKANKEVRVLCFNYFKAGELINIKFRGPNKDFKMSKDAELCFYNLDAIIDDKEVIIVEGEMDALSLHESGFYNVISVPNGASVNGQLKLDYLDNSIDYFTNKAKITICTDNDRAGNILKEELIRRLGKERCFTVSYPDNLKDANEVLLKYGKEGIKTLINEAKEYPIEGILTMDEIYNDVANFYENGYPMGIKAGIKNFDEHLQLMPGQFTTVTGIPGSGKSEFIDNIMVKTAINHSWNWAVLSFENQPTSIHATKLMEKVVNKSFSFRKNPYDRMNTEEFKQAVYTIDKYFTFINVNTATLTLDGILAKCKELVLRKGVNGILIDPYNYIEHQMPKGQSETQYISECLSKIKAFCLSSGVHLILIAHPKKMNKDEKGNYNIPTLYDIAGSAHFFNKTDNGITVYRNYENGQVDVYIQKVRYGWLGKLGFVSFKFNIETREYIPI
jgi:twinkle protein